jgi:hypothetical protein
VIDLSVLRLLLLTITGWLDRREREALAYLVEENRVLRRQLGAQRLRLTDDDRRLARFVPALVAPVSLFVCSRGFCQNRSVSNPAFSKPNFRALQGIRAL